MPDKKPFFKIGFLCSPNLGIMDNWLPVIVLLKEKCPALELTLFISKAGSVQFINQENVLIKLAETLFDRIIFKTHSGLWLEVNSFSEAISVNRLGQVPKLLIQLLDRFAHIPVLKYLSRPVYLIYGIIDRYRFKQKLISLEVVNHDLDSLLFDVYEEHKVYNAELIKTMIGKPKYSICHGINIDLDPIVCRCPGGRDKLDVRAYLFSKDEIDYYTKTFCLSENQLRVVGIPRHEDAWIMKMLDRQESLEPAIPTDTYVFIISRSLSPYFPYERKKKALIDIKRLVIDALNFKIIIKLHPKESHDGLYEDVFGIDKQGKEWMYSDAHPFYIGRRAFFAISFFSGVAIDMIALDIPVVEYLDLRGLPAYDNDKALRDETGDPVFSYRYLGFVLGASNYDQLRSHVSLIMRSRTQVIHRFRSVYHEKFPDATGTPNGIATEILTDLNGGFISQ